MLVGFKFSFLKRYELKAKVCFEIRNKNSESVYRFITDNNIKDITLRI